MAVLRRPEAGHPRFDLVPHADRGHDGGPTPLLRATIGRTDLAPGRPSFRVEHAPGLHMRVVAAGQVLFWARVKSFYEGVWLLAAPAAERPALSSAGVACPPISMADVRAVKHAPGSEAWLEAWARFFSDTLTTSPASILHPGLWELATTDARLRDPRRSIADAQGIIAIHGAREPIFETWALNGSNATVPTRPPSPEGASRIKALRKLARAGTLPPLLLWFVSGLDLHVLLDGHDRALAARLEGVPVSRIVVSAMREMRWEHDPRKQEGELQRAEVAMERARTNAGWIRQGTMDVINNTLVRAFAEAKSVYPKTRAYPIPGGSDAWSAEVRQRLIAIGAPADHAMLSHRP